MRRHKFLITGLPRSRTAWLSEFMCDCIHEPVPDLDEIEQLTSVFEKYQGVSDSAAGFWIEWILEHIKPRTVVVERPLEEVEKSLETLLPGLPKTNYCDLLLENFKKVKNHPLVMRVPFDSLSDTRVMQKVFWHLRPGDVFDEGRFLQMCDEKIVCDLNRTATGSIMKQIAPFLVQKEKSWPSVGLKPEPLYTAY